MKTMGTLLGAHPGVMLKIQDRRKDGVFYKYQKNGICILKLKQLNNSKTLPKTNTTPNQTVRNIHVLFTKKHILSCHHLPAKIL